MLDIRVAQIVKSDPLAPSPLQYDLEPLPRHTGRDGGVLLHRGRKQPPGIHAVPVLPQHLHYARRQEQFSDRRFGFGDAQPELSVHLIDLLVHRQQTDDTY